MTTTQLIKLLIVFANNRAGVGLASSLWEA